MDRVFLIASLLVWLVAGVLAADAIARHFSIPGAELIPIALVVITALLFVFRLSRWIVGRASRQYVEALWGNDLAAMRRKQRALLSLVRKPRGHYLKDFTQLGEAAFHANQGKFEESLKIIEAIPQDGLDQNLLPGYFLQLAWTKVQTGKIDDGVELVRHALDLVAVKASSDWSSLFHGVRGTALILTNRPAEALPLISPIFENNKNPGNRSCAAHYMGLAFKALGRSDEARASFERSVNEAPRSLWGQRSHAALANNHVSL